MTPCRRWWIAGAACAVITACGRSDAPKPAAAAAAPIEAKSERQPTPTLPEGLSIGGECPAATPSTAGPLPAASALVPLEEGLTLSYTWNPNSNDPHEYECIVQVAAVTSAFVDVTQSCGVDGRTVSGRRHVCLTDLAQSFFYLTETFEALPPVIVGTTMFSLSTASFRELKTDHKTRHRYIEVATDWRTNAQPLGKDTDGTISSTRFDRENYAVIVNDQTKPLPVLSGIAFLNKHRQTVAKILDDERFPLVLDYDVPEEGFRRRFTKISYPVAGQLESRLATEERVDVYGIYFDFASDRLRPESAPVLRDIAAALTRNPDWKLTINGHTDSVGADASNLELSRRRAQSVRTALIGTYAIAPDRLATNGYGASRPQASNDTPDGRAKNRRVELVRQR